MNSTLESSDFANRELARKAVVDSASLAAVGDFIERQELEGSLVSYAFESKLKGYPDWRWNVVMYVAEGETPTISEVLLLPTESSLKAPAWVPWSERLADYQALQAELEAAAAEAAAAEASEIDSENNSDHTDADDDKFVDFDEDDSALATDVDETVDAKGEANETGRKLPGFNLLRLLRGKKKK